jgi:hypothetical protein
MMLIRAIRRWRRKREENRIRRAIGQRLIDMRRAIELSARMAQMPAEDRAKVERALEARLWDL